MAAHAHKKERKSAQKAVPAPDSEATPASAAGTQQLTLKERLLPEGGLLPWWVGLIISVYALLKLGLTLEHPCGVLGTWSPVSKSGISRAYRQLSVCTHPDKLIGHSAADIHRGEMLFKRASGAREQLLQIMREAAAAEEAALAQGMAAPADTACSTHLDTAIWMGLQYLFGSLIETGPLAILQSLFEHVYDFVTLQYDVSMSISIALLSLTAVQALRQLLSWLLTTGPLTTIVSAIITIVICPLPTLGRFVVTPPLRWLTFVRLELLPAITGVDAADSDADADAVQIEAADADAKPTTAAAADSTGSATAASASPDGLRQRGRLGLPEVPSTTREEAPPVVASGEGGGGIGGSGGIRAIALTDVLKRKPLPHARAAAAAALQFDLLLSTSKHVIPLVMLLATSQVFNGLWSSMATAQVLHKLPSMRPELHHVLVMLTGLLHTILCAGKSQLTEMQENEMLQLQWQWSPMRDVLTVTNLMLLGATFSSTAGAGNEPSLCASFAAGVSLRLLAFDWMPATLAGSVAQMVRRHAQVELVGVDEIAVRAGNGVGSCAGGIVRSKLGWLEWPWLLPPVALLLKVVLLLLPVLACCQWSLRCVRLVRRLRDEQARERPRRLSGTKELFGTVLKRRLILSGLMAGALVLLVTHFMMSFDLNAINSSLGSFLIVALSGCLFESLLATYDVRGRLRSAAFFLMFMLL